jgi:deoxyribodipyrimidine photo-lyase
MENKIAVHWFRRDLRLDDNTSLHHALQSGLPVVCVFIFDKNILDLLEDKNDRRVQFIYDQIESINAKLNKFGSALIVKYGFPNQCWKELIDEFNIGKVFCNDDYEPYAINRDNEVRSLLEGFQIEMHAFKDHVIFEKDEVVKDDGKPYTVYTPYSRKWLAKLEAADISSYEIKSLEKNFYKLKNNAIIQLTEMGFKENKKDFPSQILNENIVEHYAEFRDIPGVNGTTRIGLHLRFGTVSIRKLVAIAKKLSTKWLNELCWREFYMCILWHFPHVVNAPFKSAYSHINWINNPDDFERWKSGTTGYPIVDAGMRELNETGFMHNRVRMITASFLTKHLLIDWRWGEAYFANKLLDFELSSNNGGWQWAAGSGCDAAPYFRIFNPSEQTKKFDPEFKYISKWVPEFQDFGYPQPIVEHKFARERCLRVYKESLEASK